MTFKGNSIGMLSILAFGSRTDSIGNYPHVTRWDGARQGEMCSRPRPSVLARYIAASARETTVSYVSNASGNIAIPMLAPMERVRP